MIPAVDLCSKNLKYFNFMVKNALNNFMLTIFYERHIEIQQGSPQKLKPLHKFKDKQPGNCSIRRSIRWLCKECRMRVGRGRA